MLTNYSIDTNIPLECVSTDLFGEIDNKQLKFIRKGALDLILIENASELVRQVMMDGENIEHLLETIAGKKCQVVNSTSFVLDDKYEMTSIENIEAIERLREEIVQIPDGVNICTSISAIQHDVGHYASFFYLARKHTVYLFDSMEINRSSFYTRFFEFIVEQLFPGAKIEHDICIKDYISSLQLTGGFEQHPPVQIKRYLYAHTDRIQDYNFTPREKETIITILSRKGFTNNQIKEMFDNKTIPEYIFDELLKIIYNEAKHTFSNIYEQSTESQNHFCYFWSIWILHLRLENININKVIEYISSDKIDPLIVIKRYIYSVFHVPIGPKGSTFRLVDQIPKQYRDFWNLHFQRIWTNDILWSLNIDPSDEYKYDMGKYPFHLYSFDFPTPKTLKACLKQSYDFKFKCQLEECTPLELTDPTDAKKACGITY